MPRAIALFTLALALMALPRPATAQQRRITGTLLSGERDIPFAGAAIGVVGTNTVACADRAGRFSLDAPPGAVRLRIAPIGFEPREVVVEPGTEDAEVMLGDHVIILDELKVVGYTTPLGSAPGASLRARDVSRVPAASVAGSMQGKLVGASISSNSGSPGGDYQIDIRGISTIIGNAKPLIVVDGIVVSDASISTGAAAISGGGQEVLGGRLADLNPLDVESIEVSSGPTASARYGPRAANGVVAITTRHGHRAETPREDQPFRCFIQ